MAPERDDGHAYRLGVVLVCRRCGATWTVGAGHPYSPIFWDAAPATECLVFCPECSARYVVRRRDHAPALAGGHA